MSHSLTRAEFIQRIKSEVKTVMETEEVVYVCKELRQNLRVSDSGLEAYGIDKVASYAAMAALCHAYGVPLSVLKATDEEVAKHQAWLMKAFAEAGQPVLVVVTDDQS